MKQAKAENIQTKENFIKSQEQLEHEKEWRKKQLELDLILLGRAIEFKKKEIETGNIIETMEGFEGKKPKFVVENEIDINQFQIDKIKDQLSKIK